MQIYVCVKYVQDTAANIRVIGGNAFDDSRKFVMNPYDEYGVGEVNWPHPYETMGTALERI